MLSRLARVCKNDQETSIKACVVEALVQLHKTADHENLVVTPESSAIGKLQSNGVAERTIQLIEDAVRSAHGMAGGARRQSPKPTLYYTDW